MFAKSRSVGARVYNSNFTFGLMNGGYISIVFRGIINQHSHNTGGVPPCNFTKLFFLGGYIKLVFMGNQHSHHVSGVPPCRAKWTGGPVKQGPGGPKKAATTELSATGGNCCRPGKHTKSYGQW